MKGTFTLEAEDYEDLKELRKAANYSDAYLALYKIKELLVNQYRKDESNEIFEKIINDVNYILSDCGIYLDRDVQ